jgi:SSS family solute:Na+ symporter
LPGIGVLIGGLWVANLYYWGFNQYIIQRALAAKNLREAQNGLALAGFLKLLIPLIVVIPGIVAFVYYMQNEGTNIIEGVGTALYVENPPYQANDNAFPWLIRTFVPTGLKGLVVAALAAAIVSSLASMMNSVSTIFTMDIYRQYINPTANNRQTVNVGRGVAALALVIAIALAPLMQSSRGIFNVIQEYTGLVSPGILAVFMLGLFYKKATNRGAVVGVILSILIALLFKFIPIWTSTAALPFLDQMGYTFLITCVIIAGVSYLDGQGQDDSKGILLSWKVFRTGPAFNISAFAIVLITAFLYTVFW